MKPAAFSHFIFVDFENVGELDLSSIEGSPAHVTLLIGRHQSRIALQLVTQIHRFSGQIELIEVGASGRNALDLTLAAYLGRAIERDSGAEFVIISKDKDFDAMIRHFRKAGMTVSRHESLAALAFPGRKKSGASPAQGGARRQRIIARLSDPQTKNRPRSRKSLVAHIRDQLGTEASDDTVNSVFDSLVDGGVIAVDSKEKIRYRTRPTGGC